MEGEFLSIDFLASSLLGEVSLFPLPDIRKPVCPKSKSNRIKQRYKSKMNVWRLAIHFISVLNALSGGSCKRRTPRPDDRVPPVVLPAVHSAHAMILREAARLSKARRGIPTGVLALNAVLKSSDNAAYGHRVRKVSQVPMKADVIDEPGSSEHVVDMLKGLPEEEAQFYQFEENVVDWEGKSEVIFRELEEQYGFVGGTELEYIRYFRRTDIDPTMWGWGLKENVRAIAGFSVVPKKDPTRQRKLLMQVASNYLWCDPKNRSNLGMHGGGSIGRLHCSADQISIAAFDQSNAFTAVATPPWMWPWVAAPPVRACYVWDVLPPEFKAEINPYTWVYPLYKRLAMGSSHSIHILMSINIHTVGKALFMSNRFQVSPHLLLEPDAPKPSLESIDLISEDAYWCTVHIQRKNETGPRSANFSVEGWVEAARATRRSAERIFVMIHFFAGCRREGDIEEWMASLMREANLNLLIISVDLAMDYRWDLTNPVTFSALNQLVLEGLIDGSFGGAPCSTWSRARFNRSQPGPRPVRTRGVYCWGLPDLHPYDKARVAEANLCLVNLAGISEGVSLRGGAHGMEHPADPGEDPFPSIWDTDLILELEKRTGSVRAIFHQCVLGGPTPKSTCISGTLSILPKLLAHAICPGVSKSHVHEHSIGRDSEGAFLTRRLQTYPSEMCRLIAKAFVHEFKIMAKQGSGPGGHMRSTDAPITRVSAWGRKSVHSGSTAVAILNEETARDSRVLLSAHQHAIYVHVDDGVCLANRVNSNDLSNSEQPSDALMRKGAIALEQIGFWVKDQMTDSKLEKIIGYQVERRPARFRFPADKSALLYNALMFVYHSWWVNVDSVRSLLGLWLWGALLKRELLSIPHAVFSFVIRFEGQVVKWWPSARREIWAMAAGIMGMIYDVGAPICPYLFASDAEGDNAEDFGGYGIVASAPGIGMLNFIFEQGSSPARTICRLDGDVTQLKHPERELKPTIPFTRLPHSLFNDSTNPWLPIESGRWTFGDHITLGEARAVLRLLVRLSNCASCHRSKILSLEDNSPVSGAWAKGRSPAPALNFLLRKRCSFCVAAQLNTILPWTETKLMPADDLSRSKVSRG